MKALTSGSIVICAAVLALSGGVAWGGEGLNSVRISETR